MTFPYPGFAATRKRLRARSLKTYYPFQPWNPSAWDEPKHGEPGEISMASGVATRGEGKAIEDEDGGHRPGWSLRRLQLVTTGLRVVFGAVWLVDGLMKFIFMQPSDVSGLIQTAGQGQPTWLAGWFSYWNAVVSANPGTFLTGIGALEIALGLALILGFLRKPAYLGGIALSFMLWAVDEGFGGPYGPGSTDIGAAVMYMFVFVALLLLDGALGSSAYSLDRILERRLSSWRLVAQA